MRISASHTVGRDTELAVVANALAATRQGNGGAVFLVGESGIGKSRMAAVTADQAFAADMSLLRGRGSVMGRMVPFRPLTEAVLSLLRSDSVDLVELGPYRAVIGRLIPQGLTDSPTVDGGSLVVLAEAVLRLIGLAGRDRGCVMVLDDLQDADPETLAVIEYLIDNLDRQPALLLGTVRSDPGAALDLVRLAAQRGAGKLVELGRLSKPDVYRLAGSCLGIGPTDVPDLVGERLWTDSAGNPLLAEQILAAMVERGLLVSGESGWRVVGELRTSVPTTLTRRVARQLELLTAHCREMLSLAAVLGRRFPLAVVQEAMGVDDRTLLNNLHGDVAAQLVAPDEQTPDWYAFVHPLIAETMLILLTPAGRRRLAARAADAVETVHPGLPGEWCQLVATLRLHAGDATAAGRLLAEAGRRALVQGAAESAVTLLEQANDVLDGGGDATVRAHVLESLLYALAEAGLVERAFACASTLDHVGTGLDPRRRGLLHTRLAWAASIAGRTAEGLAQVDIARDLLGPDAAAADIAPLDVVAAHLVLDLPGIDRLEASESMAWRAATVAQSVPLPVVACQAWQLLGALIRRRDLDEATACLERARSIAVEHQLPIWEIHALVRLGNDDALRHGGVDRLEQASKEAVRAGAVIASLQAEASIAMQAVLAGRFGDAGTLIDQVLASTIRLRLVETTQYTLLTRAILAAHQGRRREMDAALAEFGRWEGDESHHAPLTHGLAQTFCALLEERRSHAMEEMSRALCAEEENPTIFHLAGRHGLNLLLRVLSGSADWATYHAVAAEPASQLRWNRHFVLLAGAVLSGRSQQASDAASAMTEAAQFAAPFAMARHLGLRLVSESAIADGWGTPVPWLRTAEGYFHTAGVPAVASACRAMLRRAGVATSQRRTGAQAIPAALRLVGVTVREFEVLQLLRERLGNREIASRLHLSPRTVEKHVASLIAKTRLPDRVALSRYAITLMTV